MNQYQEQYAAARASVQAVEEMIKDVEQDYIKIQGIVNPDNTVPKYIYCIEDEEMFEKANIEFSALLSAKGLEDALNKAKAELQKAEDALIAYGISIAPAGLKEALSRGIKANSNIRSKMLDIVFRLDTATVR